MNDNSAKIVCLIVLVAAIAAWFVGKEQGFESGLRAGVERGQLEGQALALQKVTILTGEDLEVLPNNVVGVTPRDLDKAWVEIEPRLRALSPGSESVWTSGGLSGSARCEHITPQLYE